MYGIRVGPSVTATMAVILVLYGVAFAVQGRLLLGLLALLAAAAVVGYLVRLYARAAAERSARARERERAFVRGVRRG